MLIGIIIGNNTSSRALNGGIIREGIPETKNTVHPYLEGISQPTNTLLYSSLVEYSPEGKLEMDLARDFQVQDDGRTFIFNLKKGVTWHDGSKFSAEDVVYTINEILGQKTQTPFKINWDGVEVEKTDTYQVKFSLPNPYPSFIINATIPVLPAHRDFNSHKQNPIGTGAYKLKQIRRNQRGQIKELTLIKNDQFYKNEPQLSLLQLKYFPKSADLANKFNAGKIDLFQKTPPPKEPGSFRAQIEHATTPNYFAIFFNEKKNQTIAQKSLREGLALATNKQEIITKVFADTAVPVSYPVPHTIIEHGLPQTEYAPEQAEKLLAPYQDKTITLLTTETPFLEKTTEIIKEQWGKAGINVKTKNEPAQKLLHGKIKSRNYEALLFGQMLSFEPDPFSFWHSSQSQHPGTNLSLYENQEVDKILEQAREEMDLQKRVDLYKELNKTVKNDFPAVFLYSPQLSYFTRKALQGVKLEKLNNKGDRFNQIENWHLNETRKWN